MGLQSLVSLKSDALAPVSWMLVMLRDAAAVLVIVRFCAAVVALGAVALNESEGEEKEMAG